MEKKLSCRDCRFHFGTGIVRCDHEKARGQTSIGDPTWKFARDMRDDESLCGWDAKFFQKPLPADPAEFWWRVFWIAAACALVTACTYFVHP